MQTRAFKIIKNNQMDLTFQGSKGMSMTIRFMLFNQGTLEPLSRSGGSRIEAGNLGTCNHPQNNGGSWITGV